MSDTPDHPKALTPTGRVPAEQRFFGLDRRTLLPGLVVIGLFVFWTIVIPGVDRALDYDDETRAGDVFALAAGVTLDAQPGWNVEQGLRTTDQTRSQSRGENLRLTRDGVTMTVTTGSYQGSPRTLLSQIALLSPAGADTDPIHVRGPTKAFRTSQGEPGLGQGYTTVEGEGVAAALVLGDLGVRILATGPETALNARAGDLQRMIDGIRYDKAGQ